MSNETPEGDKKKRLENNVLTLYESPIKIRNDTSHFPTNELINQALGIFLTTLANIFNKSKAHTLNSLPNDRTHTKGKQREQAGQAWSYRSGSLSYQLHGFDCRTTCGPRSFGSASEFQFYLSRWWRWTPRSPQLPSSSLSSFSLPCVWL